VIDRNVPKAERFAAVLEFMRSKFGGLAQDELPTLQTSFTRLSNQFRDLRENLGEDFLFHINIQPPIDKITNFLATINAFLDKRQAQRAPPFDPLGPAARFNEIFKAAEDADNIVSRLTKTLRNLRKEQDQAPRAGIISSPLLDSVLTQDADKVRKEFLKSTFVARKEIADETAARIREETEAAKRANKKFVEEATDAFASRTEGLVKQWVEELVIRSQDVVPTSSFAKQLRRDLESIRFDERGLIDELAEKVADPGKRSQFRAIRELSDAIRFGGSIADRGLQQAFNFFNALSKGFNEAVGGFAGEDFGEGLPSLREIINPGAVEDVEKAKAILKELTDTNYLVNLIVKTDDQGLQEILGEIDTLIERGDEASKVWRQVRDRLEEAFPEAIALKAAQLNGIFLNVLANVKRITQTPLESILITADPDAAQAIADVFDSAIDEGLSEALAAAQGVSLEKLIDKKGFDAAIKEKAEQLLELKELYQEALSGTPALADLQKLRAEFVGLLRLLAQAAASNPVAGVVLKKATDLARELDLDITVAAEVLFTRESINRIDALRVRYNKVLSTLVAPDLLGTLNFEVSPDLELSLVDIKRTFNQIKELGTPDQLVAFYRSLVILLSQVSKGNEEAAATVEAWLTNQNPGMLESVRNALKLKAATSALAPIYRELAAFAGDDLSIAEEFIKSAKTGDELRKKVVNLLKVIKATGQLSDLDDLAELIREVTVEAIGDDIPDDPGIIKFLHDTGAEIKALQSVMRSDPLRAISDLEDLDVHIENLLEADKFSDKVNQMRLDLENFKKEFLAIPSERTIAAELEIKGREKFLRTIEEAEARIADIKAGFKDTFADGLAGIATGPLQGMLDETLTVTQAMEDAFRSMVDGIIAQLQRLIAAKILETLIRLIGGPPLPLSAAVDAGANIPGGGPSGTQAPKATGPQPPPAPPLPKPVPFDLPPSPIPISIDTSAAVASLISEIELARPTLSARVGLTNPEALSASVTRSALPAFTSQPAVEFDSVLPQSAPVNVQIIANDATSIERSITSGNFERAMTKVVRRAGG